MNDTKKVFGSLRIDEVLRYLSVGFVLWGILYACNPTEVSALAMKGGIPGVSVAAFVFGALMFYVYRPLVQTWCLYWLKDCFAGESGTTRLWLMNRYSAIPNRRQAELFWYLVRNETPDHFQQGMRHEASGIHMLYMSSLLFFAGFGYSFSLIGEHWVLQLLLIIAGIILGGAALVQDMQFEKLEEFALRSFDEITLDGYAQKLGFLPDQESTQDQDK